MAQPPSGKPSLIDHSPASSSAASAEGSSIRMLDALESSTRPAQGKGARRGFTWILAGLLLLVACGASWSWWNQRSHADDGNDRMAQASGAVTIDATRAVAAPASAASAAIDPAPAATIVALPEPTPAEPVAAPASAVDAAASELAASAAPSATVTAAATPHAAKSAKPKPNTSAQAHEARAIPPSNADRKRAAATTATTANKTAAAPSSDPDVALLSAMLATMSGEPRTSSNGAPSAQTQLTIAQLVQRCNVRGVKDAIETFECKRRICEGYWGKADACPMSLSPKKN